MTSPDPTSVAAEGDVRDMVAKLRGQCAKSGPCSDMHDGCSCSDAELMARSIHRLSHKLRDAEQDWRDLRDDENADLVMEAASALEAQAATIAALQAEVSEQARLNGMGAERELALQARNAELEAGLQPFADIAAEYADDEDDDFQVWQDFDALGATMPLRNFRRARTLLSTEDRK